jgi:DNA sulfur modification protein DndD
MHLTQLQLRNWRSYRNATFSFPVPDKSGRKNIILIGAQNGVGKTSFLVALYLGLFGREAMSLIEGFRAGLGVDERLTSYQKLIEGILHRPAKTSEDPHCSVCLTFLVDSAPILIQRRWTFRQGGKVRDLDTQDGEEVLIEINGRKKLYGSWKEANKRIEEAIFPANVMPCLFFDGEQAQERVEAAGGRALFDAVKTLYGTGLLDQLSESLKSFIANEKTSLAKNVGVVRDDELEKKRHELDTRRDQLKALQDDLQAARKRRADADARRVAIENELYSLVGDKTADIQEYSSSVIALQQEEAQLRQTLIGQIGAASLPLAVGRSARRLVDLLNSESVRDRWLVLKDEASNKAGQIVEDVLPRARAAHVEPPLTESQTGQLRAVLERALERLWSPPPADCAETYRLSFLSQGERDAVLAKLHRVRSSTAAGLGDTAIEFQGVSTRLAETRTRFERTRDIQPQLSKLKGELQTALDDAKDAATEVAGYEHRERGEHQAIQDLRAAIGQMESRKEAQNPIQAKLEVAQRLRSLVDDAKDRLVPLCRDALEERCTIHFREMISDEYRGFKARFESDSEPWLEGPKGQQVLVSMMSGAQKRAFGLAFTLAVADVAGREAPIVVDTPVGNMDSDYRTRVLKYVAEAAPGQVIFLSHNEEIYGRYVETLRPKIAQQCLVLFEPVEDGAGVSRIVEGRYF